MSAPQILDIYDKLTQASDDRTRARVIAEAFAQLEERYPHLSELATRSHVSESELRLRQEIEKVRADVAVEIEKVRGEIKALELRLTREIVGARADLLKWSFVFWVSQLAAILILIWRIWPAR